jgi:hypothetical protein
VPPWHLHFKLSQGLGLVKEGLEGRTFHELPDMGGFPSKRHFYNFHLSVSTFDASTTQKAVLRVYEDLNCGAANLNKQQVHTPGAPGLLSMEPASPEFGSSAQCYAALKCEALHCGRPDSDVWQVAYGLHLKSASLKSCLIACRHQSPETQRSPQKPIAETQKMCGCARLAVRLTHEAL